MMMPTITESFFPNLFLEKDSMLAPKTAQHTTTSAIEVGNV